MKLLVPYLLVRDIDASVAFYRDVLGFSVDSTMVGADGKTEHAEVAHGSVRLMFGLDGAVPATARPYRGACFELYIDLGDLDVDHYYAEVRRRGASIVEPIDDRYWGDRTFSIIDHDGYRLTFAQRIADPEPARRDPEATAAV